MVFADRLAELTGHAGRGVAIALAILVRRTGVAGAPIVDHDLSPDAQLAVVEQRVRIVDAPAQLRETALLRFEEKDCIFRRGLAETRYQRVVARRARLFGILQAEHQFVAGRDVGLPFEVQAALGEAGERARLAVAATQIVDFLRREAQRETHAFAATAHFGAADQRIVGAGGDRAQATVPRPGVAAEIQLRSEHLHHAAHGVAAVQRAGRATHHFDAVEALAIDQGDVLVGRVAEDRVVEAETVHQMQHFRTLEPAHDHHALPGRGLLHEGADFAVQRVHRRLLCGFAQARAADDGGGGWNVQGGFGALGRGDLHRVQTRGVAIAATRRRSSAVGGKRMTHGKRQYGDRRRILHLTHRPNLSPESKKTK